MTDLYERVKDSTKATLVIDGQEVVERDELLDALENLVWAYPTSPSAKAIELKNCEVITASGGSDGKEND